MLKAIKLNFKTPVHFGRGREELDKSDLIYHSDSLKSALYACGLPVYDAWKNEKNFFNAFRISSCFPYADHTFFLPKPRLNKTIEFVGINNDAASKKEKKIEYLEKQLFEEFLSASNSISLNPENITPDGIFACADVARFTKEVEGKKVKYSFFKTEPHQRVSIPGADEKETDSKPYIIDRLYFEENCGLYFLAEFGNETIQNQVLHVLRILGENGIGTDRTVGNGLFEFNPDKDIYDFEFNIKGVHNTFLTLGLYLPSENEHQLLDFDKSLWGLIKRGGFMAGSQHNELAHLRRKSIYMFTEASVLKFNDTISVKGKYENLAPAWNSDTMHPVWRDGQCLYLEI